MKKGTKKAVLCLCIMVQYMAVIGQDINFSQFYELPLLRNPGLAGIFWGDFRLTSSYKNQWESVSVPFRTMALGAEYKLPQNENVETSKVIGLQITNDIAGDGRFSRTQIFPAGNIQVPLNFGNQTFLSLGFMGGPVQQKFDPEKMTFNDQFVNGSYSVTNPTSQVFNRTNLTYFDLAAGLSLSGLMGEQAKYYFGIGGFHLNSPKVAFMKQNDVKLNRKYVVNMGLYAPVGNNNNFIIYADYFMQGNYNLAQGGFLYNYNLGGGGEEYNNTSITSGIFYRWADALVPVLKLDKDKLGIGMSYDINISKLKTASETRGGFEVTLSYKNLISLRHPDPTSCPVVF